MEEEPGKKAKKLNIIDRFFDFWEQLLFPERCLGCHKFDELLCHQCLASIPLRKEQVCPICEKRNTPGGRVCFSCFENSPLDAILNASFYSDPVLSRAIHFLKYRFAEKLAEPLGTIIAEAYNGSDLPLPDIIVPIPLHRWRLRWRGFNQAELLAISLSEKITPGFPIMVENEIIQRRRFTLPQMKIKRYSDRRKNIQGVFEAYPDNRESIREKRILLVDDVATTGATLFECARVLKSSGVGEVFAVVLARQDGKENN